MAGRSAHRWYRGAVVSALALALAGLPPVALAAPGDTTAAIEAKTAEEAQALTELGRRKADLLEKRAEYDALGQRITDTERELTEAASRTVELEAALADAQDAVRERAIQLYRGERMGMLAVLLGARSARDLLARAEYLAIVGENDAALLDDVRRLQSESVYLQGMITDRLKRLAQLREDAKAQESRLTQVVAGQEQKAKAIGADVEDLKKQREAEQRQATLIGATPTSGFNQDYVISENNYNAATSMSAADIQAFLDRQSGTLKSYRAKDHNGIDRSAAEMIAEAAVGWGVSPKVILVTLQKEQSLITRANPSQTQYDWAMGCGKADSRTYYEYQGFGRQIWFGAQKLRKNADLWKPGATQTIDGVVVHPANRGTHAQYRYTPHFQGVMSFWNLYWRYFGDPLG